MEYGNNCFEFSRHEGIGEFIYCDQAKQHFLEFTQEEFILLNSKRLIFNGTDGGLVIGKAHAEGGIHLLQLSNNNRLRYVGEMEGWEYLSKPLKNGVTSSKLQLVNNRYKHTEWLNMPFLVPDGCLVIDTSNLEIAFILLSSYPQFIVNKASTERLISEIVQIENESHN